MVKNSKCCSLIRIQLFATPRAVSCQASLSMEFSRQEYWNGFPFPSPGDLPDPGFELGPPTLKADTLPSEPPGNTYIKASALPFMKYLPHEISRIK